MMPLRTAFLGLLAVMAAYQLSFTGATTHEVEGVTFSKRVQMAEGWSYIRDFEPVKLMHCSEVCVETCHCDGFLFTNSVCRLVKKSKCSNLPDVYPCVAIPANETLFMERLQGSCKSLQLPGCTTEDGEYPLNVGPQNQWPAALIYCHAMNTDTPSEFITLPTPSTFINAGAHAGQPNDGRVCRHTQFNKVKIDPTTLIIDQSSNVPFTVDITPAETQSLVVAGLTGFGEVRGCSSYRACDSNDRSKSEGKLSVDFRGTSFTIPTTTFLETRTSELVPDGTNYAWKPFIRNCSSELTFTLGDGSGALTPGECTETSSPAVNRLIFLRLTNSSQTISASVDGGCARIVFSDSITSKWNVFRLACV